MFNYSCSAQLFSFASGIYGKRQHVTGENNMTHIVENRYNRLLLQSLNTNTRISVVSNILREHGGEVFHSTKQRKYTIDSLTR